MNFPHAADFSQRVADCLLLMLAGYDELADEIEDHYLKPPDGVAPVQAGVQPPPTTD